MKKTEKFWSDVKSAAAAAGINPASPYLWKHRGYVPAANHYKLLTASKKYGIGLTIEMLNKGVK